MKAWYIEIWKGGVYQFTSEKPLRDKEHCLDRMKLYRRRFPPRNSAFGKPYQLKAVYKEVEA